MTAAPAVLIVADDLSGAADSAVAFAARARTAVVLDPAAPLPDAAVVAVDTDSRYLAPDAAARRAAAVLDRAGPGTLVYKKIDSTLRGNIGPETAACLAALARRTGRRHLAVVAPAFPATGRTVRDGQVLVDGAPPARRVPLAAQLAAAGLAVAALGLRDLRAADPAAALTAALAAGRDALVVDAVTDDDLARLVAACAGLPVLLAGSGGLAQHLTGAVPAGGTGPGAADAGPRRPALVCVGSRSDLAHAQRDALVGGLPATPVPVRQDAPPDAARRTTARLTATLRAGHTAVVFPDPAEPVRPERAAAVATALAAAVRPALPDAGALLVTGGETARAVLLAAGVHALTVLGQAAPGVPVLRTPDGLPVITKAGAFGDPETLLRVVRALPHGARATVPPSPHRPAHHPSPLES